ncbi:MAG TPA: GNAT family N-acetyltransferase [Dehalococcoidia bacterium]|nr:GNAT family N-acetyltransferase [Dehalococcoidia bacterium]
MTVEYRPVRADEFRRFLYNDQIGFGGSTADENLDFWLEHALLKPEETLSAFEDGEPVAQMGTFPLTMRWNGREIGCGGVTSVSTLPSHRRRGHVRELMTRSFAVMREQDQPIAMLWASMAAIYQRFGYGVCFTRWRYDFDPRTLRYVDEISTPGNVRLLKSEDASPLLDAPYRRFAAPRSLMLTRTEEIWRKGVLQPWRKDMAPFLIAVYEEAGEILGYTIYIVERGAQAGVTRFLNLTVRELVWQTPAAHRALVNYLAGYDLAASVRILQLPSDDPLFYMTQEPRELHTDALDGTLVRIVDVPAALEGRGYDADGCISFAVADDLCPWNAGNWELTVEGGWGRVRRLGTTDEGALCLNQRALAMLVSGYTGATQLARLGLVAASDATALRRADDLFRTACSALCLDMF